VSRHVPVLANYWSTACKRIDYYCTLPLTAQMSETGDVLSPRPESFSPKYRANTILLERMRGKCAAGNYISPKLQKRILWCRLHKTKSSRSTPRTRDRDDDLNTVTASVNRRTDSSNRLFVSKLLTFVSQLCWSSRTYVVANRRRFSAASSANFGCNWDQNSLHQQQRRRRRQQLRTRRDRSRAVNDAGEQTGSSHS